ncbi:MAG: hypothetical protein FWG55_05890 [Candidatus Bathyarchaeota archaeon]|nr:hypothetical protein [Candidatus Termiticorpusculum sp.]
MSITWEEALGLSFVKTKCEVLEEKAVSKKQSEMIDRQQKVIELLKQGVIIADIAKQLGVNQATIYHDIYEWSKTELASFIQGEWIELHVRMKYRRVEEAYRVTSNLLAKFHEKQANVAVNFSNVNQGDISAQVNELIRIGDERQLRRKSHQTTLSL